MVSSWSHDEPLWFIRATSSTQKLESIHMLLYWFWLIPVAPKFVKPTSIELQSFSGMVIDASDVPETITATVFFSGRSPSGLRRTRLTSKPTYLLFSKEPQRKIPSAGARHSSSARCFSIFASLTLARSRATFCPSNSSSASLIASGATFNDASQTESKRSYFCLLSSSVWGSSTALVRLYFSTASL